VLKRQIEKTTREIEVQLRELGDDYAKFDDERNGLFSELETIKRELEQNPEITASIALVRQNEQLEGITKTVRQLGGVDIVEQTPSCLKLRLAQSISNSSASQPIPDYLLTLSMDSKTRQLIDVELVPGTIFFEDILEEALRTSDVRFLICELQARIVSQHQILAEVSELARSYKQIRLDRNLLTMMLPTRVYIQLQLAPDYPRPHARVTLAKVEGVNKQLSEHLRTLINKAPSMSLSTAVLQLHQETAHLHV